jgi:eukaryotic-like serine/threonine-protein kinase
MPELKGNLSVGDIVANDYQILGVAGAGGMGVVYCARDLKLERTVALKFLPAELSNDADSRRRILREARTASGLDHPNIGVIHTIEEIDDGTSCIVMAYYDGQTLGNRIRQNRLSVSEALGIAIQMASGLADAHAHKVVHRDIKPSNVMLTSSGGVRIVDFGLASVTNSSTASKTGMTGTVAYMSPEQAMGGTVDQRTDIWALGCVLVEMLTGHSPFERETVPAMIIAILNEPPRWLDELPPGLQQVLYRALAKNPAERYQNCGEILSDLEGLRKDLVNSPDQIKQTRPSAEIRKARESASVSLWGVQRARRRRWVVPVAVAGAIVVILAAVVMFVPHIRAHLAGGDNAAVTKHIVVLPFDNIGNNPENAVLVQGLMDSLAGRLSNLGTDSNSLWVIPTSEVRRLNVSDPSTALSKLGATLAIQGSVERNQNDVRLNLNLIDTRNLRQIGSADVDDRTGDLSMLQDEAVAKLADLMKIHMAGGVGHGGGSANPAAYEDYLKGLGYMERSDKAGNLDQAIAALQQSIQTDPRFALGYAQLGGAYLTKHAYSQDPRWLVEAEANAQKAAELDSNIPEVYVTLGQIHETTGKHDLAMQEFQHALSLDPRDADAESGLAGAYENAGRIQEAEAAFQKAAALRPDSWKGYSNLGAFYDRQNMYPKAVEADQHAIALTPDNAQVYANLGGACADSADPKLLPIGEQALRKSIQLSPSYAAYANLGDLLLLEHRPAEAEAAIEQALKLNDTDYNVWNFLLMADEWQKKDAEAATARHHTETLAEQAVKLQPSDPQAQSVLAYLYAQDKQNQNAIARIQTALALSPDDPSVLSNVAEAYENMGDHSRALEYIEKALQKGYPLDQVRAEPTLQGVLSDPELRLPHKQ